MIDWDRVNLRQCKLYHYTYSKSYHHQDQLVQCAVVSLK